MINEVRSQYRFSREGFMATDEEHAAEMRLLWREALTSWDDSSDDDEAQASDEEVQE